MDRGVTRHYLKSRGYRFVRQLSHQEEVTIDGRKVVLSFTNMDREVVLFRRDMRSKRDSGWEVSEFWPWFRRDEYFADWRRTLGAT